AAGRRWPWFEGAATPAPALLLVDAWFDTLTSSSAAELALALAEAVVVELPLAVVCLLLARDAEHRLRVPEVSGVVSDRPRFRLVPGEPIEAGAAPSRRPSALPHPAPPP